MFTNDYDLCNSWEDTQKVFTNPITTVRQVWLMCVMECVTQDITDTMHSSRCRCGYVQHLTWLLQQNICYLLNFSLETMCLFSRFCFTRTARVQCFGRTISQTCWIFYHQFSWRCWRGIVTSNGQQIMFSELFHFNYCFYCFLCSNSLYLGLFL